MTNRAQAAESNAEKIKDEMEKEKQEVSVKIHPNIINVIGTDFFFHFHALSAEQIKFGKDMGSDIGFLEPSLLIT